MSLNLILNREDGSLEAGPSRTLPWQRSEPLGTSFEAVPSSPRSWQQNRQLLVVNSSQTGAGKHPLPWHYSQPSQARPGPLSCSNMPTPRTDSRPSVMNTPIRAPGAEPPQARKGLSITDILNTERSQPKTESLSPTSTSITNPGPPRARPGPLSIINTPNDRGPTHANQVHHIIEPSQARAEEYNTNTRPVTPNRAYRKRKASHSRPRVDALPTLRATQTPVQVQVQVHGSREAESESSEPTMEEPPGALQSQIKMEEPRAHAQNYDDKLDTETCQAKMEHQALPTPSNHGLRHIQPRPLPPEIPVTKRTCTSKKVVLPPRPNRRRHLLPYEETIMWIAPPTPTEHPPTANWVFGNGKGVIHPASSPTRPVEYERGTSLSPMGPRPPSSPSQHSPPSKWTFGNGTGVGYPVSPEGMSMAPPPPPPPPPPHIQLPPTANWVFGKNGVAYPTLANRSSRARSTARPPPANCLGTGEDGPDGPTRPSQDSPAPVLVAPAKGKRSKFEERERAETALVREMRACIRCRNQRIRCVTLSNDPTEWCSPCMGVRPRLNKKIVHKIPCIRAKCTDVVLFRPGILGNILELGKKWEKLTTDKNDTKAITMRFEFCEDPVVLDVCLLQPPEGHIPTVSTEIPRYSVTDIHKTASWFKRHVEEHALKEKTLELTLRGAHPLVLETYKRALAHSRPYASDLTMSTSECPHQKCLSDLLRLWFASRYLTESSRLCEPDTDTSTTLGLESVDGKVPSPELIAAQIEYIVLGFLVPLRATILSLLEDMVAYNKPRDWYTIYLAVFIILHVVAVESKERFDDAISKSVDLRYTIPRFVQELQWGGGVLLAHWFYYRRNYNPLDIKNRAKTLLSDLTEDQFNFMVESYKTMGAMPVEVAKIRDEEAWEDEMYWISQMYDTYELRNAFIIDKDGPILIPEAMKEHYHGY